MCCIIAHHRTYSQENVVVVLINVSLSREHNFRLWCCKISPVTWGEIQLSAPTNCLSISLLTYTSSSFSAMVSARPSKTEKWGSWLSQWPSNRWRSLCKRTTAQKWSGEIFQFRYVMGSAIRRPSSCATIESNYRLWASIIKALAAASHHRESSTASRSMNCYLLLAGPNIGVRGHVQLLMMMVDGIKRSVLMPAKTIGNNNLINHVSKHHHSSLFLDNHYRLLLHIFPRLYGPMNPSTSS